MKVERSERKRVGGSCGKTGSFVHCLTEIYFDPHCEERPLFCFLRKSVRGMFSQVMIGCLNVGVDLGR